MGTVTVRYIVDDVDGAIAFYRDRLGFEEVTRPAPPFALLAYGDLRLALSAPGTRGGGSQAMSDGTVPEPGGWNRFSLPVDDLEAMVAELDAADVHRRSEIIEGAAGRQVLIDDPSGNPVELFEAYDGR